MIPRKQILFLNTTLFPGGAEHTLLHLVKGMTQSQQYQPVVACLKEAGSLADDFKSLGVAVYANLLQDKYDAAVIYRLMKIISKEKISTVVTVGSGGDRMFWGTLAGRLAGVKIIVWSHTYSQPGHLEFEPSNRVLYPLVDQFIALGKRHKACLANRDKIPHGRITVIPNGIEICPAPRPGLRDRARAVLGLADENILAVAIIANIRPAKRHDLFIRAAVKLIEKFRDVHFFIIGDGPERDNVRLWANQSGLLGNYLSLLGHRYDVQSLMYGLDLVCVNSDYQECLSLSAMQAMSAGVPVVSNIIGSMDELIADNQTGFFYKPLSPESLSDRLFEVAQNPELRKNVGCAGRERIIQNFSTQRMVNDFFSLFEKT
jgi:glycosyltransferase involved in cell wall biosynthesis